MPTAVLERGSRKVDRKVLSISSKRQITIPQKFYQTLGRQAQIRPAAEAMLHNAEEIANGNAPFETYEDVFGSEDE